MEQTGVILSRNGRILFIPRHETIPNSKQEKMNHCSRNVCSAKAGACRRKDGKKVNEGK